MKIVKVIIASFLAVGLFVGCSTKTPSKAVVETKGEQGVLFVYRPKNDIWRHKRFNLYINGTYEDLLMNGRFFTFNKPAGEYLVEVKEDTDIQPRVYSVKVKLSKNKIKYLRFGTENIEGHLKLKSVRKSQAIGEDDLYKKGY